MNPNRYSRVVSRLATSLAVLGACFVASAQTIPPNGEGLPAGAVFDSDPDSPTFRTFTWTPTAAQVGQHQITFWVTDGIDTDSETITITVLPAVDLNGNSDVDGDGHADLMLQSIGTRAAFAQRLNGSGSYIGTSTEMIPASDGAQMVTLADMNGDGVNDLVVRLLDGSNTHQVRYLNASGTVTSRKNYAPGAGNWRLVGVYDQNKDGNTDLVWHDIGTGKVMVWLLGATGNTTAYVNILGSTVDWRLVAVGDLDRDGNMDLVMQRVKDGQTSVNVWLLEANGSLKANWQKNIAAVSDAWRVVGVADYNGDNGPDLVIQNTVDYRIVAWIMNSSLAVAQNMTLSNGQTGVYYASWQWNLAAAKPKAGDENGDGFADILWMKISDGKVSSWRYDGQWNSVFHNLVGGGHGFGRLVALADMDADGIQDLVWSSSTDGVTSVRVWLMNADRTIKQLRANGAISSVWLLCGVGDMNADGFDDLVFQHQQSGKVSAWLQNGTATTVRYMNLVGDMDGWKLWAIEDMNRDGFDDMIWQRVADSETRVTIWYMSGTSQAQSMATFAAQPSEWELGCFGDYDNDGYLDAVWFSPIQSKAVAWLLDADNRMIGTKNVAGGMVGWEICHW